MVLISMDNKIDKFLDKSLKNQLDIEFVRKLMNFLKIPNAN